MIVLSQEEKKRILKELLENVVKTYLTELNVSGIDSQFSKQRSLNFKSHSKKMQELVVQGIQPEFLDFINGVAVFKIKSASWDDKKGKASPTEYEMAIRFYDWDKFFDDPTMTFMDKVKKMAQGNLGISCGCNSFKYNYGYQTHIKGSEFFDDSLTQFQSTMPAPITNPQNVGIGCKHLGRLLNKHTFKLMVVPVIAKSIFEKLPKNTGVSPSAPNSKRVSAGVGQLNKKR